MQQQIEAMLELQNEMNIKVHPQWREQGYEWYRAIWIECAEMLDHYGWKWWKKQSPDIEQVKLELIDIWHFGLSALLSNNVAANDIARAVQQQLAAGETLEVFALELEKFVEKTLATKYFDISGFVRVMQTMDMDMDELYRGYVGKNVLNFFRQDHGYKQGTYQKTWAGREDNEHLVEISIQLDATSSDFRDSLYRQLKIRYQECV